MATRRMWVGLVAVGLAGGGRAADGASLLLAVAPNRPPVVLSQAWSPFAAELSRAIGMRVELKLYERVGAFVADCEAGAPDLIFAAPNVFFLSHRAQGYLPLVRGRAMLKGVVFVRKDSPLTSVRDLHGKTIAFVGPRTICSVLTRQAMASSRTALDFNASFAGSTVNVVKAVELGKADAGATLDGSLVTEAKDDLDQLRIILETPPVAPHPLAAHPRVPPEVRERIAAAVLAMAGSEEGRRLLAGVRLSEPIRASYERDYRVLESAGFEHLRRRERSAR